MRLLTTAAYPWLGSPHAVNQDRRDRDSRDVHAMKKSRLHKGEIDLFVGRGARRWES